MGALFLLMKGNWEWVLLGIAVIAFFGYIGVLNFEVKHYKAKAGEYAAALHTIDEKQKQLEREALALTRKWEREGTADYLAAKKSAKLNEGRIKNDKASSVIRIPKSAICLYNNSDEPDCGGQTTPNTVAGHDGKTAASSQPGQGSKGNGQNLSGQPTPGKITDARQLMSKDTPPFKTTDEMSELTLTDILLVSNINRQRLNTCNIALGKWQGLWADIQATVKANQ